MSNNRDDDSNAKRTVIVSPGAAPNQATRILGQPDIPGRPDLPRPGNPNLPKTVPLGPGGINIPPAGGEWPPLQPYSPPSPGPNPNDIATAAYRPPAAPGTTPSAGDPPTTPYRPGGMPPARNVTRALTPGEWNPGGAAPSAAAPGGDPTHAAQPQAAATPIEGLPVVGWLVIVNGPGRGKSVPINYGNNSVGRDPDQKICINFGDDSISSKEQAFIRYNPKDRSFTLIPNLSKSNFVSVNEDQPMTPVVLNPMDRIEMGVTKLRFVPFCGQGFDWADPEAK